MNCITKKPGPWALQKTFKGAFHFIINVLFWCSETINAFKQSSSFDIIV